MAREGVDGLFESLFDERDDDSVLIGMTTLEGCDGQRLATTIAAVRVPAAFAP